LTAWSSRSLTLSTLSKNRSFKLSNPNYSRLREEALKSSMRLGDPSFYTNHSDELLISHKILSTNNLLRKCRVYLDESLMGVGHGLAHSEAVATDAGAIYR